VHRAAALALAATLLVGAASCSADDGETSTSTSTTASPTTTEPAAGFEPEAVDGGGDTYAVPDELPDAPHGTLLRYQEMTDYTAPGSTAYRILYLSTSLEGDPIAVSGMASVPTAAAPEDGRPLLTIAHGTTGIADACAPSKEPTRSEMTLARIGLGDRFLIAATDYEGMGTPGRHPYLVGASEGRSAIDAIIAAGQLPEADPGDQLAIAGYSQGGHGALWTNEVAAEWAPELEVVGTFAGAPASEISVLLAAAPRLPQAGFAYLVIAGIAAAHPEADPAQILTPEGLDLLDAVDEGCVRDVFAAVATSPVSELIRADGPATEPWSSLAEAQDAGQRKTNDAPVLIIQSRQDTTVPPFFAEQVSDRMCANDQVVDLRWYEEGGHTETAIPAYREALPWLEARFASDDPGDVTGDGDAATAVTSTCAS
jgi:pimeloyl-ACP methyl ester carboxylesterase